MPPTIHDIHKWENLPFPRHSSINDDDNDPVPHLVPADPPLYVSPAECRLLWIVLALCTIGLVYIWFWAE